MMKGWNNGILSDLVYFQRGFDITKAQQKDGHIPVVSSSGISSYHNEFKQTAPGIVIGRKGTLGSVHFIKENFWPHDTTLWSKEIKGEPRFIYYLLKTLKLEQYDVGNANPTLNRNHIHKLKITYPNQDTQKKIAEILAAYDDLIENNLKRIKLLEEMAQITYEEWFVRLRFPGHESTIMAPETGLPEGWRQKQLADYFPIKTGKKDANIQTADGQYPFFTCSQGTYRTDVYSFDAEAIILAGNGEFNIKYYRGKFEAYQRNYVLIPNDSNFLFLLFLFMKHYLYQITAGSKGAVIKYLTKDMIANTKFHEPTISVLTAFNDIIVPVFHEIENLEKQNQCLREARDILLPRLMTGVIDVESYDPAGLLKEAA